jgi:hypothetical protein
MTGPRLRLDDVSLVCVETRRPRLAEMAMQRCMRGIAFRECLLLGSGSGSESVPGPIQRLGIPPLTDVAGYSGFMVRDLVDYFRGTHALVVQWDGFVVRPECWDERFLDYDYIGAPWPDQGNAVGNGGFSLRSRRLLESLRRIDVADPHPEDYRICVTHRAELESRFGIRFAPPEVAARFSWEATEPIEPTFGLHGFFNFHRAMNEAELIGYFALCDDAMLQTIEARRLLKNLYRSSMQDAARALHARRMRGPPSMRVDAWKLRVFAALRSGLPPHRVR